MNKNQILDKVADILVNRVQLKFTPRINDNLKAKLGMDSLDIIEAIMEIESEFKIRVNDQEYCSVYNVSDLVDLVVSKKNA